GAYVPSEVTDQAHHIAADDAPEDAGATESTERVFVGSDERIPTAGALNPSDKKKSARGRGLGTIQVGREDIDVAYLAQLVDPSQTSAIAQCIEAVSRELDGQLGLVDAVERVWRRIREHGLDGLAGGGRPRGDLAMPRPQEIHGAISRYRKLKLR
ncbi:MAG: ATPase, partial [Kocuria sp.]|nr:ATPase [Kocuria sp.]